MRKMRKYAALAAAVLVLMLAGCGKEAPEQATAAPEETAAATQATVAATQATEAPETEATVEPGVNGMEFAPEEMTGAAVDTPYITLYCPVEWVGTVNVAQGEKDGNHTVTFTTVVAEEETVLFSLLFGPSDRAEGFQLGQLEDETAGTVYVFAAMNEEVSPSWSDEDYANVCAMQERVNDMIMQLHEDPRFHTGS